VSKLVLFTLLFISLFQVVLATSGPSEHADVAPIQSSVAESSNKISIELHEKLAPVLVANVDGIEVRLQFDLGDRTPLVLRQSVLDSIKAVPTGETAKFQGTGGVFEVPMFKVARVRVGTAVFTDVIARLDAPRPGYEPAQIAQGFLGNGLLKSYEVVLDYRHRAITLVPRHSDSVSGTCKGAAVPFSVSSPKWRGEPVTEANTDMGRVTLWWDTGAPASVLRKTVTHARSQSSGDSVTTKRFELGGTDFGPWEFELWDVSLPGFDGVIGHNFFAKHLVCIDFPGSRVVIDR
jgi:hypothetical protein